jgi:hypothetical protein
MSNRGNHEPSVTDDVDERVRWLAAAPGSLATPIRAAAPAWIVAVPRSTPRQADVVEARR